MAMHSLCVLSIETVLHLSVWTALDSILAKIEFFLRRRSLPGEESCILNPEFSNHSSKGPVGFYSVTSSLEENNNE